MLFYSKSGAFDQSIQYGPVETFTRDLGSSRCADLKPIMKTQEAGCLETVIRAADSFQTFMRARDMIPLEK